MGAGAKRRRDSADHSYSSSLGPSSIRPASSFSGSRCGRGELFPSGHRLGHPRATDSGPQACALSSKRFVLHSVVKSASGADDLGSGSLPLCRRPARNVIGQGLNGCCMSTDRKHEVGDESAGRRASSSTREWRVRPLTTPTVNRRCSCCGTNRAFICSQKFRVRPRRAPEAPGRLADLQLRRVRRVLEPAYTFARRAPQHRPRSLRRLPAQRRVDGVAIRLRPAGASLSGRAPRSGHTLQGHGPARRRHRPGWRALPRARRLRLRHPRAPGQGSLRVARDLPLLSGRVGGFPGAGGQAGHGLSVPRETDRAGGGHGPGR